MSATRTPQALEALPRRSRRPGALGRDLGGARRHDRGEPFPVCRGGWVLGNDKMRDTVGVIRQILAQIPYEGRDDGVVGFPDPAIVLDGRAFWRAIHPESPAEDRVKDA